MRTLIDSHDRKMALQDLEEARKEMLAKLYEMEELIKSLSTNDSLIWERAKSYWYTSIENNLVKDCDDLGSMVNFSHTLKELKEHVEEVNAGVFEGAYDTEEEEQ